MSNDAVMTVTVKGIGDFSDVVSNVGSVQKALTKLKLPDKLGDSLNKNITNFYREYEKYQKKISEGIKTQGDYNQVEKSLNNMRNLYQAIGKDAQKLTELDMKDILNLDTGEFKKIMDEITSVMKQIGNVKIDTSPFTKVFKDIQGITKNSKIVGENGLLNKIIGSINTGQITEAKKQLQELQNYAKKVAPRTTADGKQAPGTLSPEKYQQLTSAINSMNGAVTQAETAINPLIEKHNNLQKELDETKQKAAQNITKEFKGYNQATNEVEKLTDSLKRMHQEEFSFNREAQNIDRQIQSYFGLSQMIRKVGDIARDAFATVKELDKAMTETAVVTNFSVGDMWDMLPTYTQQANQLGSTIRDVYEAATLYYQQGLNTNQAMSLANETLKMARIAGLDAAEATNMMTAALRGFNMEINQQSAQKINDIYSELAAITASDTKEIGSAMERTASIANSANMEFATTSAFLAQMIETTREAPENLGTAMKTIVARFQEMKQDPTKLVDSEGVAMDANKVDKALKTIGVNLMNTKGEFRDLDDVFLDISQRWDSLTQGQQRYIATIAAGSRQQSRFIAMMSNYERTMELVDAANNSAGASQRQFEKTLDSMEAKLNKLKNAWDQFTMGLMNNQILKFSVDALTEGFTIVNKFIDILGRIPPKPFEGITKSVLTLVTTLGMLNFGKKASRGLVMGGAAWWKGEEGGFTKNFAQGFKGGSVEARGSGKQAGITWTQAVSQAIHSSSGTLKGAMHEAFNMQEAGSTDLIKQNLTLALQEIQAASNNFGMGENGKEAGDAFVEGLVAEVENGQSSINGALQQALDMGESNLKIEDLGEGIQQASRASLDLNKTSIGFKDLTKTAASAGDSIRDFGYALQGTPLEGFGNTLIRIGNLMDSMSRTAQTFGKNFSKAMEAAGNASGAGGKTTAFFSNMFPNLTKIVGLLGKIPPPILAIMAALAVVGAIALKTAHDQKKALESATDAAAKASEAYDSAKQETSELADAIEQVKANEDAFDSLVVGTAAFNEQLVIANDQILELIKKYPMLNDYLTTDENGLMHISNEGLNAVKEYQKQRQANASALNLIQAADLNSIEAQQKADQMRKTKGTDTLESLAQRRKEADLVEQQAEAQQQMAKLNAVNTALVDKEIGNREKVSAILADQYDARRKAINLEGESIHDLKQEYADFYGYKYDKSTKKLTDIEGNEIDVDKDTIRDAVKDIRILTDIEVDAGSVDTAITSIDKKFSKHFKGNTNFFSDILSSSIETDENLLREVLQNPGKLQETVSELSSKEIAAIMGVSADAVEAAPDKYSKDLIKVLTEKAENIAEAQSEAWGEFGAMLAQAEGMHADAILDGRESSTNLIQRQLTEYTAEQRDLMLSIGKSLESSAGVESMKSFIRNASDIYREGTEDTINELNGIIENVNWDSPTARLKVYKDLTSSTIPEIQKMGQELLESTDSANLLGQAFEEFYNSSDWAELSENMDSFVDSTGKVNAVGVEEMAKQCNSLNNLLDTGAISAGGVAAALNALGTDGELTLLDLNSAVLQLLSTFGQLDDIIGRAHNSIENFDWGLDTGESADFVKEAAEKWNELYKGGEVGNPQLEAYAKYVLGEEKYIRILNKNHGNLKDTMDKVSKYVNEYADGFDKAWDSLANGEWQGKVPKELQNLNITFGYDKNGNWEWNPGTATTEQLSEWLQAVKGIGPEMAAAMIEDWQNYSPDFRTERQKNDFYAGLDNYISSRTGNQGVTVTTQELETIAAATGQEVNEVRDAIVKTAEQNNQKLTEINNTVEGGLTTSQLNAQYTQAKTGNAKGSWIDQLVTITNGQKQVDASQAITQAIGDGFTQAQAESMAYDELSKAVAEGTDVWYKDKLLTPEDLASFDNFKNAIAEFEENSQWVEVGKAIAEGVVSYLEGKNNSNIDTKTEETSTTPKAIKPSQQDNRYTDTGTGGRESYTHSYSKVEEQQYSRGLITALKEIFPKPEAKTEPTELTPAQQQKMYGEQDSTKIEEAGTSLLESGTTMELAATSLTESGTNLTQASSELSSSAKELSSAADKLNTSEKQPGGIFTSGKVQTNQPNQLEENIQGDVSINTTEATNKVTELQTKLKELNDLINTGGTYKLTVTGVKNIQAAAAAAKTLTKNSGTQTIGVKTGKADTSSVDKAKTAIGKTEAKIQVGAKVDSAIAAARRAQRTINNLSAKIDVEAHVRKTGINSITIDGKTVTVRTAASGKHNHGYAPAPSFGSVARGRYGQVGPKGKGGLTLTGELGYEVAWLPDENRSMILGANGPQMIDLPGNAVIWDHEQSKKIVKQKAIPAGSHSTSTRPNSTTITTTATTATKKKHTDSSSTVQKAAKEVIKITQKAGKVLVWWENAGYRMKAAQHSAEINQKKLEQLLKEFGTTGAIYREAGEKYIANLKQQEKIATEKQERATNELNITDKGKIAVDTEKVNIARDKLNTAKATYNKKKTKKNKKALDKAQKDYNKKANAELTAIGARREISYEVTEKKKTKGKWKTSKKTKKTNVNLASYITVDPETGAYQIDQEQISKIANGYRDSKKKWHKGNKSKAEAIKQAAESQLNDLTNKQNEAEKEAIEAANAITEFYDTTYKTFDQWEKTINEVYLLGQQIEKLGNIRSIFNAAEDLELSKLEAGLSNVTNSLPKINQALEQNKNLMIAEVKAHSELIDAKYAEYKAATDLTTYRAKYEANNQSTSAAFDYDAITTALNFLKELNFDSFNFNYSDAVNALNANNITEEAYNKIKEGLDKIAEKQNDYYNAITDTYNSLTEIYQTIEEYQSYIADFEESLIKGYEEQTNREIDKLNKLNTSLTNAAKDLIDEVRRKLDERRKQEDNRKTEQDISKKQQRLAALRADTSGGHQVEIVQLEKELAEAQQNYGRTLEDQLLDRLSNQQDEATKQRERQIKLLETQRDLAEALGTNVEEINNWLASPEQNKELIRAAWLENQGYSDAGKNTRKQLEEEFEKQWTKYLAIAGTENEEGALKSLVTAVTGQFDNINLDNKEILTPVEQINNKLDGISTSLSNLVTKAATNLSAEDLHKEGYSIAKARTYGFSDNQLKAAGYDALDFHIAGYSMQEVMDLFGWTKEKNHDDLIRAGYASEVLKNELINAEDLQKAKDILKSTGRTYDQYAAKGLVDWANNIVNIDRIQKGQLSTFSLDNLMKLRKYKFATGGLATQTGLAWLDGTPSKPELVLNARDTQNLIALKDILSKVMNGTNDISNTYGDIKYEINVNVDKIEKDYDVDRVVEKVKKEITKGAGYRNVTQVRNFR